jgi:hypothetical protein
VLRRVEIHKARPNVGGLDFSGLVEAPAGRRGFVQARDGRLTYEDGTRARFIGFNLPARSNTPDHRTAERLAERFATLGVNVIRLHAADAPIGLEPASWSSTADSPLLDYASGSSRSFHDEGLDRFDYFVAKLKEKGIHLHVDLLVARAFLAGDGLAHDLPSCLKSFTMINRHLIDLQKEYARSLLTHVNPYTGLALVDDPAVMTVQINNEDSVIKGTAQHADDPAVRPYRDEIRAEFNRFLVDRYGGRDEMAAAWTHAGVCALGADEDPTLGTVRVVEGSFLQPVNIPGGPWDGDVAPPRYADWMAYGIEANRRFYREMTDFLRSIGVRVPIATSNLLGGPADVFGHSDGDLMENNSYFNHPLLPYRDNTYVVGDLRDYVAMNPLTMQRDGGPLRTSLVSLASTAAVTGKPFVMSEWNEYGAAPFHATAAVQTVAYACLNDWDALILYCHHTSEHADDQPADEILNLFDAYNDVALISQFGFMASVFLKGLVQPAPHRVDLVFGPQDLLTLPERHAMPTTFFPYVTRLRSVFTEGESYTGNADVAVSGGFVSHPERTFGGPTIEYAWSPYTDVYRRGSKLTPVKGTGREIAPGVRLDDKRLRFDDIRATAGDGDYRGFAAAATEAMRAWQVLPAGTGYVDGRLVSETAEIEFDPDHARFRIQTATCAYASGAPALVEKLGPRVAVAATNDRMSLSLLPLDHPYLARATEFLLTAVGRTGMDETTYTPVEVYPGVEFTAVALAGKLAADTLEGMITVVAETARLLALDPHGHPLTEIQAERGAEGLTFHLTGEVPSVNFVLSIAEGEHG